MKNTMNVVHVVPMQSIMTRFKAKEIDISLIFVAKSIYSSSIFEINGTDEKRSVS